MSTSLPTIGWDEFPAAATAIGVTLDETQVRALRRYYDLVVEANGHVSLTAVTEPERFIVTQLLDSLAVARTLGAEARPLRRAIDIGTGAGLPAIPLAIALPTIQVIAVDSIRKKVDFVRATAAALGLAPGRLEVIEGRAEELGRLPGYREGFDAALARAVAELPIVVELCLPFVRPGGVLVAFKGPKVPAELPAAARALAEVGGVLEDLVPSGVPGLDTRLVKVRKVRATPDRYPRRTGIPSKRPL